MTIQEILREHNILRILSIVAFLLVWQIVGMNINPIFLSTPLTVIQEFPSMLMSGEIARATSSSLFILFTGFVLSVVFSIPAGIAIGRYEFWASFTDVYLSVFQALPRIALLPLFIIWLGLGDETKVVIVFLGAMFPLLYNTVYGVRNADANLIDMLKSFGANEREILLETVLPGAVPFMIAGLRLAVGRAIISLIVAELFTAVSGLGGLINLYANHFDTAKMFVPIIVLVIIALAMQEIVSRIEKRYSTWHTM